MNDGVQYGSVWQSRDSRNGNQRVKITRFNASFVWVRNVSTGRETRVKRAIFTSNSTRGGYAKVAAT